MTTRLSVVPIVLLAGTQWKSSMIRIRGATMRLSCPKEGGGCKVITTLSGIVVSQVDQAWLVITDLDQGAGLWAWAGETAGPQGMD
ncbi:hypothetical protein ACLB2K_076793 [Fragaria x ananassa]